MTDRRSTASAWGVLSALRDHYLEHKNPEGLQAVGHVLARRPAAASWPDEDDVALAAQIADELALEDGGPPCLRGLRPESLRRACAIVGAEFAATAFALAPDRIPVGGWLWRAAGVLLGAATPPAREATRQ